MNIHTPINTLVMTLFSISYLQGYLEDQVVRHHQLDQVDPKIDQTYIRKNICDVVNFIIYDFVFFIKNFKTLTTGPWSPLAPSLPSLPGSP